MKILLAYSSKTKNTKKVAEAIYKQIKDHAEVDLLDIKKQRKKLEQIHNKDVALFLTCGVPREHYHADDSINNYIAFMKERNNRIHETFVCQGKVDPKVIIVFKILTWRDPNFIHKMTPDLADMVKESRSHPDMKDLTDAQDCFDNLLNYKITHATV